MSGRSEESLSAEAARWRRSYRAAQDALHDANRMLLAVWLRGRLLDPSDFDTVIGLEAVTDRSGRIDWRRLTVLVDELVRVKPHLAAPIGNPWSAGTRAVEWFLDGAG